MSYPIIYLKLNNKVPHFDSSDALILYDFEQPGTGPLFPVALSWYPGRRKRHIRIRYLAAL